MKNVLLITSSPRGEASYSAQIATELVQGIGGNVTTRALWRDPLPTMGTEFIHAIFTAESERTPEQREALRLSDALIEELRTADVVVIAAGMINFGMPAQLKTWIDHVTRAGSTFRYTAAGPEGLVIGKRVILVLAAGGVYTSGPMAAMNHLEPAIRDSLGFLGLTDLETVWVEGTAFGEEATERALTAAGERSRELLATVQ
ncbi:MAG: FMN-dependent NADH-azoreductase [Fimbriimonas sp.]